MSRRSIILEVALAVAISAVGSGRGAECSPPKLLRIVTQDTSPGIPPDSFAAQLKTVYRLGKTYARLEETEDRQNKIHGLIVVHSPDSWMVNLVDRTGRHLIDRDPEPKVVFPILASLDTTAEPLPHEMLDLELGCEVAFFNRWKSPITTLKTSAGNKVKQAFGVVGKATVALLRSSKDGPPEMLFLFRNDEIVFALKYLSYEEVAAPDMKLFAKPEGIAYDEEPK